jgi:hypothetical protein
MSRPRETGHDRLLGPYCMEHALGFRTARRFGGGPVRFGCMRCDWMAWRAIEGVPAHENKWVGGPLTDPLWLSPGGDA